MSATKTRHCFRHEGSILLQEDPERDHCSRELAYSRDCFLPMYTLRLIRKLEFQTTDWPRYLTTEPALIYGH